MMRNRFLAAVAAAALAVAWAATPIAVSPARAQAMNQLCQAAGQGMGCIGAFTPQGMGGGGMGGIDAAATGLSLGITLFSILNEMNQQPAAGPAPAAVAPGVVGSYAVARPVPWKPTWAAPAPSALTLQQKAALLGQIRPVSTGTYVSAPTSPQTTTDVQSEKTAILDVIRPLNPTPLGGAGVAASPPDNAVPARKAAMLRQLRPLDSAGARPANAADQLCIAAGQSPNCIGQFVPHGMAVPPPGVDFVSAPQNARVFNAAFGALAALPSVAADATNTPSCAQIVGFAVIGDQVQAQTAPCGASPADSDEAISAAARVPFDTAGAGAAGVSPPVAIDHPDATVAPLRAPVVTRTTLDAETKAVEYDACSRLADLERKLVSYQAALQRLEATAPMIASERDEWLRQRDDAYRGLWKDAADIMIDRLDAHYDRQIEALNDKARQAFRMRKNAVDPEFREKFDEFFLRYVLQKGGVAAKKKYLVGVVMEGTSRAIDVADWLETESRYEKLAAVVRFALTSDWVVGPEIAPITSRADTVIDVVLNGTQAWRSAGVLATLDQSSDLYHRGLIALKRRIGETSKNIRDAQAELARSRRGCGAA